MRTVRNCLLAPRRLGAQIVRNFAVIGIIATVAAMPLAARADSAQAIASELSNGAFAMLNSIDAGSKAGGPMLAPVASLASDAQSLSSALDKGDQTAAGHAMAAVVRDRAQIDAARAAKDAPALAQ